MTDCEALAESNAIYLDASALPKVDIEEDSASRLVRVLIYGSRIPIYCSLVSFGEFFSVAGKKLTQKRIGSARYLFSCRSMLMDLEIGKLQRAEPVPERFQFIRLAEELLSRHSGLGGGDIWHILAALHLNTGHGPVALFSFDKDLVKAARDEGLRAVYGNDVDPDALIQELTSRGKWVAA